jgi:hypothetical protein
MVPPSVWDLVRRCVDELEKERIDQLNTERNVQPLKTRSDQILSNISSMDISPIENIAPVQNILPVNIQQNEPILYDEPMQMIEPPKEFSRQINYPIEEQSEQSNIPTITYPTDNRPTIEENIPSIQERQIPTVTYRKPTTITYKDVKEVPFKQPLPISYKKPITYTRKRKMSEQYIEPITISDPFTQGVSTQDYTISDPTLESDSFGILPPPEYRSEEIRIPKIRTRPSRIPIPILPLPSCIPKTTSMSKIQKRTLSTIEPSSKSAITKPQLAISQIKQKALTTKSRPQITYSGVQTRSQTVKNKPINYTPIRELTYSPIQTRSKSKGTLVKVTPGTVVKANSYICPLCGIEFRSQANMERHMRVLHNATEQNYDKWKK